MTTKTRQLVNGSLKWLVTLAFVAGGIVAAVKSNTDTNTKQDVAIQKNVDCIDRNRSDIAEIKGDIKFLVEWAKRKD